ncbi:MAG: hypothetical protein JRF33_09545 [Deltaproteobacteria bacterium]|nr:hypothetical protein [Deltaproteobacteria bacterium]
MRHATRIFCTMVLFSGFTLGCGGDKKGLDGSQCELVDCSFDTLECRMYDPPNEALMLYYKRILDEGVSEFSAIISIDLDGVEKVSGWEFEAEEFVERVRIYRPASNEWPEFDGNGCEIKSGDAIGDTLDGHCSFKFINGRFLTANFNCTLIAAEQ